MEWSVWVRQFKTFLGSFGVTSGVEHDVWCENMGVQ